MSADDVQIEQPRVPDWQNYVAGAIAALVVSFGMIAVVGTVGLLFSH